MRICKTCTDCGTESFDWVGGRCRRCYARNLGRGAKATAYRKSYYQKNRERRRAYMKEYRRLHKLDNTK